MVAPGVMSGDICGVDGDGTLRGSEVACEAPSIGTPACAPRPIVAAPLHRKEGEGDGEHIGFVSVFPGDWELGTTSSVRVRDDLAFLARGIDGIRIVSIADPAAPVEIGHFQGGNREVLDLEPVRGVDGRRYVIGAGVPGCQIVDVTDPAHPELVAEVPFSAQTVFVEALSAYFVDATTSRVEVYDLSLPRMPKRAAHYEPADDVAWRDTFVSGGVAYLSDARGSGIHVVDFRDPAHPRELAAESDTAGSYWHTPSLTTIGGESIALDASEGRGSKLRILDDGLQSLAEWNPRDLVSLRDVTAAGARIFVTNYRDGIRVLDLDDPHAPALAGYFNTWTEGTGGAARFEGAVSVDLDRAHHRIYVADSIRGLVILEAYATILP